MKQLLIAICLTLSLVPSVAFAQTVSPEASISAAPAPSIDYTLPYPGMLPDNPLYFLKVARDRVIGFLISDPLKKASFDLLQADKRLQAGVYLINAKGTGQDSLAEQTISKGYNYLDEGVAKLKEAAGQGKDVSDTARRISLSAQKHEEVLTKLLDKVKQEDKAKFTVLLNRVQKDGETARKLIK